ATCDDPNHRDAARAITLGQKAVELAPQNLIYWNTLGVARYRAGDWTGAIDALQKAEQSEPERNLAFNAFFLTMAHWQLAQSQLGSSETGGQASDVSRQELAAEQQARHREQAGRWFDRAVQWMEKSRSQDEELKRFRAEAAELLGASEKSD